MAVDRNDLLSQPHTLIRIQLHPNRHRGTVDFLKIEIGPEFSIVAETDEMDLSITSTQGERFSGASAITWV